ncbi:MAG: cytochrome P460 family protein [Candidatus Poribacteria bacterium]|nr:cytochrome P460 family protein [Candidatus Poribacteria bacterium]
MHRSQCFFTVILLCCLAFIACDEAQQIMKPVVPPILSEEDARGMRIEITPTENGNPGHGFGRRSVYINGIGVAALKDDTLQTFPIDTLIIKEINNNTNTFVQHVATMKKTDDPVYAAHNGWLYTQHTRQTETAKFVAVGGDVPGSTSEGCHACHAQAPKDSVFTQLPTPDPAVEDVPTPSEPEAEPEPTQEQPQETQTPEETDDAPSEVEPRPPFVPNL